MASFQDILPTGVSYVAGSSQHPPSRLPDASAHADQPTSGQAALVWSNIRDRQPSSTPALFRRPPAQTDTGLAQEPTPWVPPGLTRGSVRVHGRYSARRSTRLPSSARQDGGNRTVGGGSGIRTHGDFRLTAFQVRP